MDLKSKKINFLGDSITEGVGVSDPEDIYLNILKREAALGAARNYGLGGTRIAAQRTPSNPDWDRNFISRVDRMEPDADLVVVFGGTPLGCFADRTPYTFYGACRILMERLIGGYPESTIVFLTPLHRWNEDDKKGDSKKADVAELSTYVEIIKETARYYAIPVLDLFAVKRYSAPRANIEGFILPGRPASQR